MFKFIGIATALSAFLAGSAQATSVSYDILGNIDARMSSGPVGLSQHFKMEILPGQLVLTYDDNGTSGVTDDFATIRGTTRGCIGNSAADCNGSLDKRASQPFGIREGSGDFTWDITMTEAVAALTKSSEEFAFGMQINAGTITLLNTTAAYKDQLGRPGDPSADVTVKTDNTPFGFQILPSANGGYEGTGWLAIMGGFLGKGGVRFEFGNNRNVANWSFRLVRHGDVPPDEIPEPATVGLLAAGLIGAAHRRRKAV